MSAESQAKDSTDEQPTVMDESGDFEDDETALLQQVDNIQYESLNQTGLLNQTYFEERITIPESESVSSAFSFRKLWAFTGPG